MRAIAPPAGAVCEAQAIGTVFSTARVAASGKARWRRPGRGATIAANQACEE